MVSFYNPLIKLNNFCRKNDTNLTDQAFVIGEQLSAMVLLPVTNQFK